MILFALAALFFATPTPTRCHTTPVQVSSLITDRVLDNCGATETDDLLWHLDRSDSAEGTLDGVATRRATGKGAVVYVCDTGVLAAHDEFAREDGSAVIAGIDTNAKTTCPGGNDVLDPCWLSDGTLILFTHGTAVASMIAGKNVGIAPDAKIVAVRVMGDETVWVRAMNEIIKHAYAEGTPPFQTAIINMSSSVATKATPAFDAIMEKMIHGVDANGNPDPNGKKFLFVSAAGNATPFDSKGLPIQCLPDYSVLLRPGARGREVDGLVTVGGIDRNDNLWSGSCWGSAVEVLAPAEEVFVASISAKNRYRYIPNDVISGTSYATPYVSGMAARLLELDPTLTPAQLEERLEDSPSIVRGLPVPVDVAPGPPRRRALR